MSLFQQSVLENELKNITESDIESGWSYFKSFFLNKETQKEIKSINEEKFQYAFLQHLFQKCLGYNIELGENRNLFTEEKNISDSKKADGAIKKDGNVICVIELKSAKTKNLKEIQDQAFIYQSNHNCDYVITSNFEKIRFYINDSSVFEEFDLFDLNKESFRFLYLCISKESIFNGTPKKIKDNSLVQEEKVTKKLYSDYSAFRNEIFYNLVEANPEYDKLLLFNKTQKLLDRFLFIFFAEDRNLIPPNTIGRILDKWEKDNAFSGTTKLYDVFKVYFNVLNVGRPQKGDREAIFAYNGGLFSPDKVLDSIFIQDNILLNHSKKLSKYDFKSEVSVNILGHIFEHSLSEIEEIQNEISGIKTGISKRKKDGVFYTPEYITKYIVENTLGKLCKNKRNELKIEDVNVRKYQNKNGTTNTKGKVLFNILKNYKEWLFELKIVDPACGSGAFLNQALNYLIKEHKFIDDLIAELTNTSLRLFDTDKAILENNIYGVDINEESVEIAKLSLWLSTAQESRKLSNLSNNIKCGNSLIDDPEIAGEKAFNWKKNSQRFLMKVGLIL